MSSAPHGIPFSRNCTPTTPTASDATALTVTLPEMIAPGSGAVMLTDGAVVSPGTIVRLTVAELEAAWPSLAR